MKRTEIKKLLPSVMQRSMVNPRLRSDTDTYQTGSVLSTFIEVMEQMHQPTEHLLENLHTVFDPRQVSESFLPMLAHWTNIINLFQPDKAGAEPSLWKERTLPTEPGYLRELIATSVQVSRWRGTAYGLIQVLQMATGVNNFSIKEGKKPFHIQVGVPEEAGKYWELIERIVVQEKPAHITAEIFITREDEDSDDEYYEDEDSDDEYYEDEDSEDEYYEDEDSEDEYYEDEDSEDEYYEDEDSEDEYYEDEDSEDEYYEDEDSEDEHYEDEDSEDEYYEDEDSEDEYYEDEDSEDQYSERRDQRKKHVTSKGPKHRPPSKRQSASNKKSGKPPRKPSSSKKSDKKPSRPPSKSSPSNKKTGKKLSKSSSSKKSVKKPSGKPPRGKKPRK